MQVVRKGFVLGLWEARIERKDVEIAPADQARVGWEEKLREN